VKILKFLFIGITLNSLSLYAKRCLPKEPVKTSSLKERMTLDDAITYALNHRSSLNDLMFASKSQRNNALAALSGYLPQISFYSRFLAAKDRAIPKNQQYIYIDQLLFSFAGPVEQYRIEKIGSHIAELGALFHGDEIRYETENSFFNLYLLQTRIAPVSTFETFISAQLQKTVLSNKQGLLSSFIFEKEHADYDYGMSAVFGYEEQTTIANTNLTKALEAEQPFFIDMTNARYTIKETLNTITHLPYDEVFFKEAAHNLRKDLAIKDQEIERFARLKQLREKSYLPSASLYADIATGQPALAVGLRQLPGNFWQAGIQFNWNFDGLGNVHKAAAEEASLQSAIFAKRDKEISIEKEVSNAYHELLQLKKQLDVTCSDQSPEELFLQQKKRYEVGDLSETEYKQAVYEWDKAQFGVRDLEVKTVLKYKELLFKSGYPHIDNPSSSQRKQS
jgi:outer membrane protein TolC